MRLLQSTFLLFLFITPFIFSNEKYDSSKTVNDQFIDVYIDCNYCDIDYIRTEISFVNYVIDRKNADLHILVTHQTTGSNGREYTLTFFGKRKFKSDNDTIKFFTQQDDTDDDRRKQLVKYLKFGVIKYIAETDVAKSISINYDAPKTNDKVVDNWDYWVFRTRLRGFFNGEESYQYKYMNGSININRITEDWKLRFKAGTNYNEQVFSFGDNEITNISRGNYSHVTLVKSVSEHWSAGFTGRVDNSSYSNYKLRTQFYPAIEYNIHPYSESTRKILRFLYRVGYTYAKYNEETIYNKMEEGNFKQSLEVVLKLKQPWGTVETTLEGSNYFYDFSKNRLSLYLELSLKLFKGFTLDINGGYTMIHDQLNLPKSDISDEDILLQRRQMETQYNYWGSVGISYTFGSIYNNIVNPRFGN